jgi:hypothetical protein
MFNGKDFFGQQKVWSETCYYKSKLLRNGTHLSLVE